MIPDNIREEHILNAISFIDKNGVPPARNSKKYILRYNNYIYPPKYVISIANVFANNNELETFQFTGGDETNSYLVKLGFEIAEIDSNIVEQGSNDIDITDYNLKIEFAFRDERINVLAMTRGGLPFNQSFQAILCKHSQVPESYLGPFILDSKRTSSTFKVSTIGKSYLEMMTNVTSDLCYVAYIDCQIKIKLSELLFQRLSSEGFFSVWDEAAPLKYFGNSSEGYLVVFRVYRINKTIPDSLLAKGRKGRNYYFRLEQIADASIEAPVIDDLTFSTMKSSILDILQREGFLVSISHTEATPRIIMPKCTVAQLDGAETLVSRENASLTLGELEQKIRMKKVTRRVIIVESQQYYRDPDIVAYAKKRASGYCECCDRAAPFKNSDNSPFLETHHLVPLAYGGNDSIDNVVAAPQMLGKTAE